MCRKPQLATNLRKVDLNLINILVELIKEPNLTNTAKKLNMTQPAVSMALQRLRTLYCDALFVRQGRTMIPTEKALAIRAELEQALSLISNTFPATKTFDPLLSSVTYKLNVYSHAEQTMVADFIAQLDIESPNSLLEVHSNYKDGPDKLLRERQIDVHIDYKPIEHPDFYFDELIREKFIVVARKDHTRLQHKTSITLSEFLNEKMAVYLSHGDKQTFSDLFLKTSPEELKNIKIGYQGSSLLGILATVSQSDMITIVPEHVIHVLSDYGEVLIFEPPFECNEFVTYMNWFANNHNEPSHRWLREFITRQSSVIAQTSVK
ncbi:LysR substrate-binding domain-containing protein [Thalassotalea atypica]|uniref:LysR substrate-binding domain-containing protein n=1 Tax=Thalassotalea atypica TaxID=2054316 RepID=UPI0025727F90|nr:LysR substrate-binding domain-containing protein [Thalassotalea atypica]